MRHAFFLLLTLGACESRVLGPGGEHGSCDGPGQCMLVEPTCCSSCGTVGVDDVVAIHQDQLTAFRADACGGEPQICPACAGTWDPRLFAACDAGACQVGYLPTSPLSACAQDADCVLRAGLGCCECDGGAWVALAAAKIPDLLDAVCAPMTACDLCQPQPPPELSAACDAGRCVVVGGT